MRTDPRTVRNSYDDASGDRFHHASIRHKPFCFEPDQRRPVNENCKMRGTVDDCNVPCDSSDNVYPVSHNGISRSAGVKIDITDAAHA